MPSLQSNAFSPFSATIGGWVYTTYYIPHTIYYIPDTMYYILYTMYYIL